MSTTSKISEQHLSQSPRQIPTETQVLPEKIKLVQIWENKFNKLQIRVLDIANKIVLAEIMSNKMPIFLTSIDLEENYKMVKVETRSH